ncbi:MAG: lecithin retinol acyltransferase family protein [Pirellulales bacterium]
MAKGDLLYVPCRLGLVRYRHYGIDLGDGNVIHLAADSSTQSSKQPDLQSMEVRSVSLQEFAGKKNIRVESVKNPLSVEETLERAQSKLGQKYYHLTEQNCEHFARWCKSDAACSFQVERGTTTTRFVVQCGVKAIRVLASRHTAQQAIRAVPLWTKSIAWPKSKLIPSALACDAMDWGANCGARYFGATREQSQHIGTAAGCLTAGIVGFAAGGPAGSTAMIGLHLASSRLAQHLVDCTSNAIGDWFSSEPQSPANPS